jgi:hypothetical protein
LRLVKGRTYKIVFWAQSPKAPYSFNEKEGTIAMNYEAAVANSEDRDAFFNKIDEFYVDASAAQIQEETVKLDRPFAKVVVATSKSDFEAASKGGLPEYTGFTAQAYPTFDLKEGKATGEQQSVSFSPDIYGNGNGGYLTVDYAGVNYYSICSNYLLVAAPTTDEETSSQSTELLNAGMTYGDKSEETYSELGKREFANVPVAPNYVTWIFGEFFTKYVTHNVEINPEFTGQYVYDNVVAKALAEGGQVQLTEDVSIIKTLKGNATTPTKIDLNGHTLTFAANAAAISLVEGASLEISGGDIVVSPNTLSVSNSNITVGKNGVLVLDNVTMSTPNTAVFPDGNASEVTIKNSVINAEAFGVGTNASTNHTVTINIENSTITAWTAVMMNIDGKVNIKDSHLYGSVQGLMARRGTFEVENTDIHLTEGYIGNNKTVEACYAYGHGSKWTGGSLIPFAAITVGNHDGASYKGLTTMTLNNVQAYGKTFKATDGTEYAFPAIFGAANAETADEKVTITYDDKCTFNGDSQQEWQTKNVWVNGTEVEPNVE